MLAQQPHRLVAQVQKAQLFAGWWRACARCARPTPWGPSPRPEAPVFLRLVQIMQTAAHQLIQKPRHAPFHTFRGAGNRIHTDLTRIPHAPQGVESAHQRIAAHPGAGTIPSAPSGSPSALSSQGSAISPMVPIVPDWPPLACNGLFCTRDRTRPEAAHALPLDMRGLTGAPMSMSFLPSPPLSCRSSRGTVRQQKRGAPEKERAACWFLTNSIFLYSPFPAEHGRVCRLFGDIVERFFPSCGRRR